MTTNVLPISEVRAKLPQLVEDAVIRRTYISVKGKVKAALVDAEELESLESTLEVLSDKKLMKAIKEGQEAISRGDTVPLEVVLKDLE